MSEFTTEMFVRLYMMLYILTELHAGCRPITMFFYINGKENYWNKF